MSAIAVGDKVMLVYANCPHGVMWIGTITVVESIEELTAHCVHCGARSHRGLHAGIRLGDGYKTGPVPLPWLKKIEPDAEVKTIEREALVT